MQGGLSTCWWESVWTIKSQVEAWISQCQKNILLRYSRYVNPGAPKLTISIDVELALDPKKYTNSGQEMPSGKEIVVKEQLLEHKCVTNNLNIQKCNICLECHMEKDVMMKQNSFTCKKCKDRNDPNHFIKNNMHPLWYEIEDDSPSKWIQMERRFLNLIDLTNCWDWAWLRNCLFKDVQILCHQYIY